MLRNTLIPAIALAASLGAATCSTFAIDPQPYAGCGILTFGIECPRFVGDDGTTFSIPGTGGFQLGAYVRVEGVICFDCPSICQDGPVFQTKDIQHCITLPPHQFLFDQCGTLVLTPNPGSCLLFESKGELYWVENISGFGPGDFVRIMSDSVIAPCTSPCNAKVAACIEDNAILHCIAPPVFFVDSCGTLIEEPIGPGACVVFVDDLGNQWLLQDQGNFEVGDQLHVFGPAVFCTPLCGNVLGCVLNEAPIGCTGDVNNSGEVDADDLVAVILAWGPCGKECPADVNGDGEVNVDDLLLVILNWT